MNPDNENLTERDEITNIDKVFTGMMETDRESTKDYMRKNKRKKKRRCVFGTEVLNPEIVDVSP